MFLSSPISVDKLYIRYGFNEKYGNIKVIAEKGSMAKARERGIREIKTERFMFADSDVILCKDWFKKAEKYIKDDVGAVWGLNIDVIPNELVKDIRIPWQLHAYEDAYIVNWIKKKGYSR